MWRVPILVMVLITIFWFVWLHYRSIPTLTAIRLSHDWDWNLPFPISRKWDIIFGGIWTTVIIWLFTNEQLLAEAKFKGLIALMWSGIISSMICFSFMYFNLIGVFYVCLIFQIFSIGICFFISLSHSITIRLIYNLIYGLGVGFGLGLVLGLGPGLLAGLTFGLLMFVTILFVQLIIALIVVLLSSDTLAKIKDWLFAND